MAVDSLVTKYYSIDLKDIFVLFSIDVILIDSPLQWLPFRVRYPLRSLGLITVLKRSIVLNLVRLGDL